MSELSLNLISQLTFKFVLPQNVPVLATDKYFHVFDFLQ